MVHSTISGASSSRKRLPRRSLSCSWRNGVTSTLSSGAGASSGAKARASRGRPARRAGKSTRGGGACASLRRDEVLEVLVVADARHGCARCFFLVKRMGWTGAAALRQIAYRAKGGSPATARAAGLQGGPPDGAADAELKRMELWRGVGRWIIDCATDARRTHRRRESERLARPAATDAPTVRPARARLARRRTPRRCGCTRLPARELTLHEAECGRGRPRTSQCSASARCAGVLALNWLCTRSNAEGNVRVPPHSIRVHRTPYTPPTGIQLTPGRDDARPR